METSFSPAINKVFESKSGSRDWCPMSSNRNYKQIMVFFTVITYQPS
jgi:hypothetical protein